MAPTRRLGSRTTRRTSLRPLTAGLGSHGRRTTHPTRTVDAPAAARRAAAARPSVVSR